ncbi:hypothetical protein SAMN05216593_113116 [Pseudomonas asturiensis]|uniref:Uncharacterized protein n=1 Tax=Pseudomonas asturiensis TaxID=1190415 RepID=A0A1M7PU19_9PSED|nr:hypothetical protein SAMN05216593_113116 [Pseudomonas asturiensis]
MSNQRRTSNPEFKGNATCLVLAHGYSHPAAARSHRLVEAPLDGDLCIGAF